MTPKEWAEKAAKSCTGESCTREICVHVAEDTIWEAIQEKVAISDIHGEAWAKDRHARVQELQAELTQCERISEGRREQLSRLACEKTIEWKRAENAEGIIAQRERRIAELKAALRKIEGMDSGVHNVSDTKARRDGAWCDGPCGDIARAALSPAPAQPATAAKCDHPWHRNGALLTPCPSCGAGAAPPSPAVREHCDDCGDLSDGGTHLKSCPSAVISSNHDPVDHGETCKTLNWCGNHLTQVEWARFERMYTAARRLWKLHNDPDPGKRALWKGDRWRAFGDALSALGKTRESK